MELLQDLHFLIANDDQLQEDLANACGLLLDDTPTDQDAEPLATNTVLTLPSSASPVHNQATTTANALPQRREKSKKPCRSKVRQKMKIFLLRHRVKTLKMQLKSHGRHEFGITVQVGTCCQDWMQREGRCPTWECALETTCASTSHVHRTNGEILSQTATSIHSTQSLH